MRGKLSNKSSCPLLSFYTCVHVMQQLNSYVLDQWRIQRENPAIVNPSSLAIDFGPSPFNVEVIERYWKAYLIGLLFSRMSRFAIHVSRARPECLDSPLYLTRVDCLVLRLKMKRRNDTLNFSINGVEAC